MKPPVDIEEEKVIKVFRPSLLLFLHHITGIPLQHEFCPQFCCYFSFRHPKRSVLILECVVDCALLMTCIMKKFTKMFPGNT